MFTNISVVIVNWNSNELVQKQLENLTQLVSQIIVVDNNSEQTLAESVKKYATVQLIQNTYNRGFASACNQGLLYATRQWTLFLNPDVTITEQTLADFLTSVQENTLAAASVSSNSVDYSKPVPSVLSLLTEFSLLRKIIPQKLFKQKTLVGGIVFANTAILKQQGGWDERFFLWFEDSDLTQRLLNSSYKIGFFDTKLEHIGGFSLKKLSKTLQKDLFFTAMNVYSRKYFSKCGQTITSWITKRFTKVQVLPNVNQNITSLIVPNVKKELLDGFLQNNLQFFTKNIELIIVTSALKNQTVWEYRRKYPTVRFIPITKNQGFAHTVNIGFRVATGKYVGTCNDDVMLESKWLEKLLEHVTAKTGSINPIIADATKKIESAGVQIDLKGKAYPITQKLSQTITTTDATNAACVLYNKEALNKVGLFDERFGSYLEDIDLSLRLNRAGYKNIVVNTVSVTHFKHQTSEVLNFNKSYHDFKNWILVILKNWSLAQLIQYAPQIALERLKNISGMMKANKKKTVFLFGVLIFGLLFAFTRLYKIETSLLFFNDIGRDFLVLFRWEESGKPPLLGPQTSALPYNQSAFYFYMLYPLYWLTGNSPFATIYTAVIFYLAVWFAGVWYLRKNKVLLTSFILSFVLILIHPQFLIQNRFVWNPTFLGPLILLAFYSFEKLRIQWNKVDLYICALSLSFAVSLNYSAAPLFLAFIIYAFFVFFKKKRFIYFFIAQGLALGLWNLPTLAFEVRHNFLLTNLLFTGEKLSQVATNFMQKTNDLLLYLYHGIPRTTAQFISGLIGVFALVTFQQNLRSHKPVLKAQSSSHLASALVLLFLTLVVTYSAPISVQAHYIFAVLTMLFVVISLLDWRLYCMTLLLLAYYWLNPVVFTQHFKPAYRSVAETQQCAQLVCKTQLEPIFISVQSDLHPYHNGMEFKYLFSQAGCEVKELDTQIAQAQQMAVVVDNSEYIHGVTTYNELTQFGESLVLDTFVCSEQLEVVLLKKK